MGKKMILLVEDNEQILRGNERMLTRRGYGIVTALTLKGARKSDGGADAGSDCTGHYAA